MATYCEEIGLKVGDKIRVLGENRTFGKGSIIEMVRDDGDISPLFSNGVDKKHFTLKATCGGEGVQWERVADGEGEDGKMTPCEELGYKVGDWFYVTESGNGFSAGQKVALAADDGSIMPLFSSDNGDRSWQLLKNVRKIDTPLPDLINKIKEAVEAQREAEFLVDSLVEEFEEKFEAETGLKCSVDTILSGL